MRRAATAIATAVLMLGLAGCETACPAVGFVNTVVVDTSAYDGVAELQFCVDDECSPRVRETPATDAPSTVFRVDQDSDGWRLNLDMRAPETTVIRLFAADGTLIQESEQNLDWTSPTGRCGGASTAPPIVLAP